MRKPKYEHKCDICGVAYMSSYPWEKACKLHKEEHRKKHLRDVCRNRYQEYKTLRQERLLTS